MCVNVYRYRSAIITTLLLAVIYIKTASVLNAVCCG
nr:MAG TPA: hypothetical protein [Caudoviricetes sp.]